MADETIEDVNDVIAVLKGGAAFYRKAAGEVKNPQLQKLFRENAEKRDVAVAELSAKVTARGGEPASVSWAEKAHGWYASAMGMFGDKDETLVEQLEEHEDRTLEEIRDALEDLPAAEDGDVREMLQRHLAAFKETHDQMRALQKAA